MQFLSQLAPFTFSNGVKSESLFSPTSKNIPKNFTIYQSKYSFFTSNQKKIFERFSVWLPLFAHKFTFRVTCFDTWSLSNTDNLIRLLRHCWSVQLVSVPWENKTTQYKNLLMVVTPLITSGDVFFLWFLLVFDAFSKQFLSRSHFSLERAVADGIQLSSSGAHPGVS